MISFVFLSNEKYLSNTQIQIHAHAHISTHTGTHTQEHKHTDMLKWDSFYLNLCKTIMYGIQNERTALAF